MQKMFKQTSYRLAILLSLLLLSACNTVLGEPVLQIPGMAETYAVQTIMADEQLVNLLSTPTPSPVVTPTATILPPTATTQIENEPDASTSAIPSPATSTPLPTLTPGSSNFLDAPENATPLDPNAPCNAAEFIRDVTIPDDSIVKPNSKFSKIWAIRNVGTCTWKEGEYALVMVWGHKMGTEPPIPLQFDVVPGQTAELSIEMVAPTFPGCWQGNWMLQDGQGDRFGIGLTYKSYFWVSVTVWWPGVPKLAGG